ncbi:MAG: hypothetical protein HC799_19245 [Limnothrix sp. RL_2_0]|nr:hypothetical protein [Limnothrix sp. RL_2_0]
MVSVVAQGFQKVVIEQIDLLKGSLQDIYDESERIALNNLFVETQKTFKKLSNSPHSFEKAFNSLQRLSKNGQIF